MTTVEPNYIQQANVLYVRQDANGDITDAGLSNDAKLGIGFGAGFGMLVPSAVAGWLWFGKRKRKQRANSPTTNATATPKNAAVAEVDGGALEKQQVPVCDAGTREKAIESENPARSAADVPVVQQAPKSKTKTKPKTRKESSKKRSKPSHANLRFVNEDLTMDDEYTRFWPAMA